jgi:hypothetical protein
MAVELGPVVTTTMSFNAACEAGAVVGLVKACVATIGQHMRKNIRAGNVDTAGAREEVIGGRVVKRAVTQRNTMVNERIGTIGGAHLYLMYRLRPFKPTQSSIKSNMNNAVVLRWGQEQDTGKGNKSVKIFTNGVITSAGWTSSDAFCAFADEMLQTTFGGARLRRDATRVILYNSKSKLSTGGIDLFGLRAALNAAPAGRDVLTDIKDLFVSIKFTADAAKTTRIHVFVSGDVMVFSSGVAEHEAAYAFIRAVVIPCVDQLTRPRRRL